MYAIKNFISDKNIFSLLSLASAEKYKSGVPGQEEKQYVFYATLTMLGLILTVCVTVKSPLSQGMAHRIYNEMTRDHKKATLPQ